MTILTWAQFEDHSEQDKVMISLSSVMLNTEIIKVECCVLFLNVKLRTVCSSVDQTSAGHGKST